MRFADIGKGKYYTKTLADNNGRKGPKERVTWKLIVVDKDEEKGEILASIVPEVGKPMAPVWYAKDQFQRWKPFNQLV